MFSNHSYTFVCDFLDHFEDLSERGKLSQGCGNIHLGVASKNVDGDDECGERKVEESREEDVGRNSEKNLEESNSSVSKPAKETLEYNVGLQSSHSSRKCTFLGEAHHSEDGDDMEDSKSDDCAVLSSHKTIYKQVTNVAEREHAHSLPELVDLMVNKETPDDDTALESSYKAMSSKRKRIIVDMDSDPTAMVSNKDICSSDADVATSPYGCESNNLGGTCATCFKRQRY